MTATATYVGHVANPELRFTQSGTAVMNFSVAVQNDRFDRDKNEWVEGDPTWISCVAWKRLAENCGDTIEKGTRVVVTGKMVTRNWETDSGDKRSKLELVCSAVGVDLSWSTAVITKNPKSGGGTPPMAAYEQAYPATAPATQAQLGTQAPYLPNEEPF